MSHSRTPWRNKLTQAISVPFSQKHRDSRGQTTIDFAIGISLFLLVMSGIFLFVPGALEPFEQGAQEDTVTVNRVADSLSEGILADPSEPYLLDRACTISYFDDPTTSPPDCDFSGSSLRETIGLGSGQSVNVTIRGNVSTSSSPETQLCWNDGAEKLDIVSNCGDSADTILRVGGDPPGDSQAAVTARRVVELDDRSVFMVVKVW